MGKCARVFFEQMGIVMFRARMVAFLSAVLMLWPLGMPGHARYLCRMMDRVLDACCCPPEPAVDAGTSEPQARTPDCCERLTQSAPPIAATRPEVVKAHSLAWLPATPVLELEPAFHRDAPDTLSREAGSCSACGPPLFIANCQLLI